MNLKRPSKLLVGLALGFFLLLAAPRAATSQAQPAISLAAEAGYNGYFKDQQLIPVRVTVENSGPDLEASIQISLRRQDNNDSVYTYPLSLPTTSRKQFFVYIFPESFFIGRDLKISLLSAGQEIASTHARLDSIRPRDRLYGILAGNPSAFNLLNDIEPPDGDAFVAQLAPEDLPDKSSALSALDVVLISDLDSGLISPAAIQAIRSWVVEGGHLVVTGGPNWQKTTQALSELLPLSPDGSTTIDDLSRIQNFASSGVALGGSAFLTTGRLNSETEILIGDVDLPIIVRSRIGQGLVTYLSMDPSQEPFRSWDGLPGFYARLLQTAPQAPAWISGIQFFDSAAQAIAALPNLPAPSAWLFCGFLTLYVAALGPANYFLLRKWKRRELAWLSIPALVILFSALAFVTGSRMRGTQPILHRMAVVQAWPEASHARVDGLVGLFSPRRATYQLELGPSYLAHPIPSANSVAGGNWIIERRGDQVVLPGVRIEVGGMHAVSVRGLVAAPDVSHDLETRPAGQAATLQGSVTNHSSLNFKDAVVIARGKTQRLGDVGPGETRQIHLADLAASAGGDSSANPDTPPDSRAPPFDQGVDLLTTEILGTSTFYQDEELYRRYLLLDSLLIGDLTAGGAGDGAYLIAWVEASPIPVELSGVTAQTTDLSLYIIALETPARLE